jgi:peptidoglycan L-alanyl-D-glutamate endopeptidase CwlK
LYAIGRTEKGKIVTNAKGGESPHNFLPSMAFDIAFITFTKQLSWDKKYFKKFADIIKTKFTQVECGIDWRFVDPPHFELKAWKTLKK